MYPVCWCGIFHKVIDLLQVGFQMIDLRGHLQTEFGMLNVIVTLRRGWGEGVEVMTLRILTA